MHDIRQQIDIDVDPDRTWQVVGDTGAIADWLPALDRSRLDGDLRHGTMPDGSVAVERIVDRSDVERTYSYELVEAPLALDGYRSTLRVHDVDGRSRVTWHARFDATDELAAAVDGMYRDGLVGLKKHLEARES